MSENFLKFYRNIVYLQDKLKKMKFFYAFLCLYVCDLYSEKLNAQLLKSSMKMIDSNNRQTTIIVILGS